MRTNVYVDGFNLYYGALKGTPHKWLNLLKLCEFLLPGEDIQKIRYFTALVAGRPSDPQAPQRQQIYLRALATLPCVSVHQGSFMAKKKQRPLANGGGYVWVHDTEEKGSDVNLASYLLHDGHRQDYEQAVVISNDSDLRLPIELVVNDLVESGALKPSSESGTRSEEHRQLLQTDPSRRSPGEPIRSDSDRLERHVLQAQQLVAATHQTDSR